MALSARLQVKQTQSLVITPQLMQAIRLLQMSAVELETWLAGELQQNPLLEGGEPEGRAELGSPAASDADPALSTADQGSDADVDPADLFPEDSGSDRFLQSFSSGVGERNTSSGGERANFDAADNLAAEESLVAALEHRLEVEFADSPADRMMALALLAGLDEAGYLTAGLDEIAVRLGACQADVERVLQRCQALAPTGMFARSLAECLALQLAERNRLDPAMQALLANLDRLANGERASLPKLCGVDATDLDEMLAELRALDPKPGLAFGHEPVRAVIPDVIVRAARDGVWTVELNEDALPRVLVNRSYAARVTASRTCSEADRKFLVDCLQKASWLEKSLDQRARTVLNVASEIVRRQEAFLSEGVAYLRPLNLRMIADALGIHESTVSRAAANKTIATPRGIFEFRYFFSGAIAASAGGEAHSAEAVKHRIRRMILDEDPDAVLSDDAIVIQLAREGVEIARRTVAKYRELMRIGSSVERRRQKRLKAAS